LIDEGAATDDVDDIEIFRFELYDSIFEFAFILLNGFECIVIADVAAEQQ
jgi:hypothetical protein